LDRHGKIFIVAPISYFACAPDGEKLRTEQDATDLIGEAHGSDLIVIPAARLDDDFFRLRTGVAGAFLQKFITYGRRIVVVGDISRHVEQSSALRDFVIESNRGHHICFLATIEDLAKLVK
jgi:hypothetical protein